jgi:RNA recognition motif-containing protein
MFLKSIIMTNIVTINYSPKQWHTSWTKIPSTPFPVDFIDNNGEDFSNYTYVYKNLHTEYSLNFMCKDKNAEQRILNRKATFKKFGENKDMKCTSRACMSIRLIPPNQEVDIKEELVKNIKKSGFQIKRFGANLISSSTGFSNGKYKPPNEFEPQSIVITNLPIWYSKENLIEILSQRINAICNYCGRLNILDPNEYSNKTAKNRGIGFVNMRTQSDCLKVIEHLNKTTIDHFVIGVSFSKKKKKRAVIKKLNPKEKYNQNTTDQHERQAWQQDDYHFCFG